MVLTALAPLAWPSAAEEAGETGGWFAAIAPKEPSLWDRAAGGRMVVSLGVSDNQPPSLVALVAEVLLQFPGEA